MTFLVPGEGFEPSVEDPKSSALPLGHPGAFKHYLGASSRKLVTWIGRHTLHPEMRNALVGVAILLTVGCGAYQFPGESPAPAAGTVSGRVLTVPCAPVETADSQCAGRPVPNLELDYSNGANITEKAVTDANGSYSIALKPGSYAVKLKTYMRVISGPLKIEVAAGSPTYANHPPHPRIPGPAAGA